MPAPFSSQPTPDPDDGRLTREELARRLGVAVSTTYRWQANADSTGFPAPDSDARWNAGEADVWYEGFRAAKRAGFTPVDRSGDPDELLTAAQVAHVLGYQGADPGATIRSYRGARHGGYFPEPDGTLTTSTGRETPAWRRSTVWAFADRRERHGGGVRGRSGRPRSDTPPYANDPALPAVQARLQAEPGLRARAIAESFGVSQAKAYRLIKAAKTVAGASGAHHPDEDQLT